MNKQYKNKTNKETHQWQYLLLEEIAIYNRRQTAKPCTIYIFLINIFIISFITINEYYIRPSAEPFEIITLKTSYIETSYFVIKICFYNYTNNALLKIV